jgi:hypothetical protein
MTSNNISSLELAWHAADVDVDIAEYAMTGLKNPHPSAKTVVDMAFQKAIDAALVENLPVPNREPEVHPMLEDWVTV